MLLLLPFTNEIPKGMQVSYGHLGIWISLYMKMEEGEK